MNNYFRRKLRGIRATHTSVPTDEAEILNSDVLSFETTSNKNLIDLQIYGNTTASTDNPTPESPSVVSSAGNKTENLLKFSGRTYQAMSGGATMKRTFNFDTYSNLTSDNVATANISNVIYDGQTIKFDTGSSGAGVGFPTILRAGTAYTVAAVVSNSAAGAYAQVRASFYAADGSWISDQRGTSQINGTSLKSFTVPSNAVTTVIHIARYGSTSGTITASNIMLVEGTYTSSTMPAYEPYGYKIPILLSGKNLFDISAYTFTEYKYIKYTDGAYNTASRALYATSDYIPIKPNTTYTLSGVDTSGVQTAGYAIYDSSKAYITGGGANSSAAQTFTTGATAAYLRFTSWSLSAIQLEIGSTATTYEPYHASTAYTVYLDEPLRKNGDNADYISLKDAKVYRNNAEYSYKGDENILIFDNNKGFRYTIGNQKEGKALDGFCNRYKNYKAVGDSTASQRVIFGASDSDTQMYVRKFNTDTSDTTVEDMQTALTNWYNGGNPLSVVYPTETQTAQTITFPSIATVNGTNIIKIGTAVMPTKIKAVFYK